jgi:hypothetical protein
LQCDVLTGRVSFVSNSLAGRGSNADYNRTNSISGGG